MANGDLIKLGTFYLNGVKQARPTMPWRNDTTPSGAPGVGNIPNYSSGNIEIRNTDTDDAYKINWIEVNDTANNKKLLIADRNLLVSVSWDTLNAQGLISGKTITVDGQQYNLRLMTGGSNYRNSSDAYAGGTPTNNEWDRIITNEAAFSGLPIPNATDLDGNQNETDRLGTHNSKWNWYCCYSWVQETYLPNASYRVLRGFASARSFNNNISSNTNSYVGWRPVLEVLNTAPLISDSDRDLGDKNTPFTRMYQVSDADGDAVTVVEKLNGTIKRTFTAEQNKDIAFTIDVDTWNKLELNKVHTIRIEATDNKGGTSVRQYTFKKVNSIPSKPGNITSPAPGITAKGIVNIIWGASTDTDNDALTYKIYYSTNGGVAKTLIKDSVSELSCQFDTTKVPEGSTYQIFVCANDGKIDSDFAASGIFTIVHNMAPQALSALLPVHTARVSLNPSFEAAVGLDPEGDPQHFRIQIATDENFINLVVDKETSLKNLLTENQSGVEADATGFTAVGSSISRVTTQHSNGNASLSITTSGTNQNEGVRLDPVNILGNSYYSAQATVRGAGYVRIAIEELDSQNNILRSTGCDPVTLDGTIWTKLKVTANVGQDCSKVRVAILTSSVVGATFYADEFMLVKGKENSEAFIVGGKYGDGSNSAIDGWEIFDGNLWKQMPSAGAQSGTQKVRYKLQETKILTMNQSYYWRMAAKDPNGNYGEWTLPRIIRAGNLLKFQLRKPIETTANARRVLVLGYDKIATDGLVPAVLKVEVCNNGFDTVPVWQDITQSYKNEQYATITNTTKTAAQWGVDVMFTIQANDSLNTIEVVGFGIAFD